MNAPIDYHFIPAFFLAQWADGTGKLVEYTVKHDKVIAKRVGPRATGYDQHLYSFPAVNRRSNLTPYRRPILTPLSDGFWR